MEKQKQHKQNKEAYGEKEEQQITTESLAL